MKTQFPSVEAFFALLFAVCVLLALVLLTSCTAKTAPMPDAKPTVSGQSIAFVPNSPATERLTVEKVQAPMERELVAPARLVWDEDRTVRVFTPFSGRVTRIAAKVGDRVRAGDALAQITSADFGQAQADARKATSDLALAGKAVERQRELYAHGVASAKDLQQAEADHARAVAEFDRAKSRLSAYGQAESAEQGFLMKAPVAGTVVERNLNPGQEVRSDTSGAPLFVISDPLHLWILLDVNEADVRSLKPGMSLVVTSNQFPEDSFAGTLTQLADFVDPVSRTVKLRGEVPNPDHILKAEMFVSARLRLAKGDDPTVNAKAVFLEGARRFVFVRGEGGVYTRRPVRIGAEVEGRVTVIQGLQVGEEVVVAGNLFLQQILVAARPPEGGATQ